MLSKKELREESASLINLARLLGPEGEGLDIDADYKLEEIVQMRSFLSTTRRAIDVVNKGLALMWKRDYGSERHEDETNEWYLSQPKGKVLIEPDAFYAWAATLDADRLKKLFSASAVKVGGMTETERMTFLDESPSSQTMSIQHKPRRI